MKVGYIKLCVNCHQNAYVKTGTNKCPHCGREFDVMTIHNKTPHFHVKKENYEISRESVERMVADGDLSMEDIRKWG